MTKPSPAHLELARRLLAYEMRFPSDPAATAVQTYERVLVHLSPIIGIAGVHALFARSVKLTAAEHPCLKGFTTSSALPSTEARRIPAEELRACLQNQVPLSTLEPIATLFGNLVSLLAALIGERLTTQVLEGASPETSSPSPVKRKP
jgi:hypothetical protein